MSSRLILCADDFALTREISTTIAALARKACLNAVSCMAAMPNWADDARMLEGIEEVECGAFGHVQVGLHLVLTSERPITRMSCLDQEGKLPGPDRLLLLLLARRIDLAEFALEIDRQFEAFVRARGCPPAFVDAHQHVHVYPGMRQLVIAAVKRHAPDAWVRVPADGISPMLARPFRAKAVGSTLHSLGLRRALGRAGIAANRSFAGHYDFRGSYADRLPRFLEHGSRAHLVMCHPGAGLAPGDSIAAARIEEARVLGQMTLAQRIAELSQDAPRRST